MVPEKVMSNIAKMVPESSQNGTPNRYKVEQQSLKNAAEIDTNDTRCKFELNPKIGPEKVSKNDAQIDGKWSQNDDGIDPTIVFLWRKGDYAKTIVVLAKNKVFSC